MATVLHSTAAVCGHHGKFCWASQHRPSLPERPGAGGPARRASITRAWAHRPAEAEAASAQGARGAGGASPELSAAHEKHRELLKKLESSEVEWASVFKGFQVIPMFR